MLKPNVSVASDAAKRPTPGKPNDALGFLA
jgi:hypothetical protein